MLDKLSSFVPSGEQVAGAAKTVSYVVCGTNAFRRAKWTLVLLVVTLVVWYMTASLEDLDDLIGVVESLEDSHVKDEVVVTSVRADRHVSVASSVPETSKTSCEHTEHRRPDGTVEHRTKCSCTGPDVTYTNEKGETKEMKCGMRSGTCPTEDGYVVTMQDGRKNCVFGSTPQVKCTINDSKAACTHSVSCPDTGQRTPMARALSDGALSCLVGDWNRARVSVRYTPPVMSTGLFGFGAGVRQKERTQVLEIPMSQAATERYTVGESIPVFYSRRKQRIFQHDSNPATVAGFVVKMLVAATLASAVDAASYLILPVCGLRLLDRNTGAIQKKTGFSLF